jgi:predicted helicase
MLIPATHPAIKRYAATLADIEAQGATNEGAVRDAFSQLLREVGGRHERKLTLLAEQSIQRRAGHRIRVDGVLNDENRYPFGHWEAKDTKDDLETEIVKKIARDYPLQNIIFEDTRRAVLYQNKRRVGAYDLAKPAEVAELLTAFFGHTEPAIEDFNHAVRIFNERVPEHAGNLRDIIQTAHRENRKFQAAFDHFVGIVRDALNPNLTEAEVDEMLIQHLLTERIIREVFDMDHFSQSNVIAHEVEKVIQALTSKHFNRNEFLGQLSFFYTAVENAARTLPGFSEKQAFLNTVYERFFQGFAVKSADVLGIVYTPQEIVDFMGAAVEEVLVQDFGLSLADPAVHIIDPCTGTGNFVVNLLKRLDERHKPALRDVYRHRLFANEVALMPYYIASLNIEHAFRELTGEYLPFEGLCLVDTLGMSESEGMLPMFAEENTERIQRQQAAPITVIIGNPPYNVGQQNENDNNKNRKYRVIDQRVRDTYVKDSKATLRAQVYDPYVKFWRYATDRLGDRDGIVVYVSNNSFVDQIAFDGMRKHLLKDFTHIYHVDLHGNVRQNPKLSGTTHNVFGIQVGVGITVAVRSAKHAERKLFYHRMPEFWTAGEKLAWLGDHVERAGRHNALNTIAWQDLTPDAKSNWITAENASEFSGFLPIGTKKAKAAKGMEEPEAIFKTYGRGTATNADSYVYDFDFRTLEKRIKGMIDDYQTHLGRWIVNGKPKSIDSILTVDEKKHKWIRRTKLTLLRGLSLKIEPSRLRNAIYRPFTKKAYYFAREFTEDIYQLPDFFPTPTVEAENRVIVISDIGYRAPHPSALIANVIFDLHLSASIDAHQAFPFYTYAEDGSNRRENITDWALRQFQSHYNDSAISKWDIFYYTYAVLHHPEYRTRFKDALKKELPRIPFAPDFRAFAAAGQALAALHLDYETVTPYPLTDHWTPGKPADYRVTKMRWLNKPTTTATSSPSPALSMERGLGGEVSSSTSLVVNPSLTLSGFPREAFDYKLGGRSALDWVVEQYQVKTDARSGITSDPNRYSDDETYIVNLVKRVTTVSVETVKLVDSLPPLFPPPSAAE